MRYPILIAVLAVSLAAQGPPNCSGIGLDVDVRCACIKDPRSKLCEMVKAGFYDPVDFSKTKGLVLGPAGVGGTVSQPGTRTAAPAVRQQSARQQPARPTGQRQARVVPLAHTDYLRFLHPNARLAAGFDFEKLLRSPELVSSLFGKAESDDARIKLNAALKEMDHLWLSSAAPNDVVILMTGKFDQGVAAGMFYAQGISPVFLGGAHAMLVGPEPSVQAALARLAKPPATAGWVATRARELSRDHETWIVNEPPASNSGATALQPIRQFALGFRLTGEAGIYGEAIVDSEANAEKIAAWIEQMKVDSLTVERSGSTLRFAIKDDKLLTGESGQALMNSDFGPELYAVTMAGFPGMPSSTVSATKLLSVKAGMKRADVLALLGRPLSISGIQGLEPPRENWIYQVPFGKQYTLRLDGGVVSIPPR